MRTSRWKGDGFTKKEDGRTTWNFEIEVLTPMFGGGVTADGHKKPHDPITPIRGASIRGQLRFWWRAVNPRGCRTVEELRAAETKIFGAASVGGLLDLRLHGPAPSVRPYSVLKGSFGARRDHDGIAYGAFPLRDTTAKKGDTPDHGVLHTVDKPFTLVVSFPQNIANDLAAAFWAWLNFGGVGGRTRRGFGAISLKSGPPEVSKSVEDGWAKFVRTAGPRDWPTLGVDRERVFREVPARSNATATAALNDLLGRFRTLRQGEGIGRTKREGGSNTPGRSYWPEADSIRTIRDLSSKQHLTRLTRTVEFPRAAFGTPIIFQFKDRKNGDPPSDSTLNPTGKGRLASPLILRPARTSQGLALRALRLDHPDPPGGYELTWIENNRGQKKGVNGMSPDPDWGLHGRPSPLVNDDFRTTDPIARFFKELEK